MKVGRGSGRCRQRRIPVIVSHSTAWRRHPDVTYFSVPQQTSMLQKTLLLHAPQRLAAYPQPKSEQHGPCRGWRSRGRNKAHRSQLESVPPFCCPNPSSAELPLPLHSGWCLLPSLLLCVCACLYVCACMCACVCLHVFYDHHSAAKLSWSPGSCYFHRPWGARILPQVLITMSLSNILISFQEYW